MFLHVLFIAFDVQFLEKSLPLRSFKIWITGYVGYTTAHVYSSEGKESYLHDDNLRCLMHILSDLDSFFSKGYRKESAYVATSPQ